MFDDPTPDCPLCVTPMTETVSGARCGQCGHVETAAMRARVDRAVETRGCGLTRLRDHVLDYPDHLIQHFTVNHRVGRFTKGAVIPKAIKPDADA